MVVGWTQENLHNHIKRRERERSSRISSCLQAIKQFIDLLNSQHQQRKAVSPEVAIQYLSARKFDIPKAVALYEANLRTRQLEGLYGFHSTVDPLRSELETGKFTVLVSELNEFPILTVESSCGKEMKVPFVAHVCVVVKQRFERKRGVRQLLFLCIPCRDL